MVTAVAQYGKAALVAALAFAVGIVDVPEDVEPWQPWTGVAAGVAAVAVAGRRSMQPWGTAAALLALVAVAVGAQLDGAPGQVPFGHVLVIAVLLADAAWRRPPSTVGALAVAALVTALVIELAADGRGASDAVFVSLVWALGMSATLAVRWRRQAAEAAEERVRVAERERIARDLHDVVAHHVSAIAMTAEGGRLAADPEITDQALASIHDAATRALDEMRRVVAELRDVDSGARVRLADLTESFSDVGGPAISVELPPSCDEPPAPITEAIHRIAREAVTNARRHAAGATRIDIAVERTENGYTLIVDDDGRDPPTIAPASPGHGLHGMGERARLLDGTLAAGPRREGGWRVSADLPAPPARRGRDR